MYSPEQQSVFTFTWSIRQDKIYVSRALLSNSKQVSYIFQGFLAAEVQAKNVVYCCRGETRMIDDCVCNVYEVQSTRLMCRTKQSHSDFILQEKQCCVLFQSQRQGCSLVKRKFKIPGFGTMVCHILPCSESADVDRYKFSC